jgi:SWI/SNF-related matrix-associated actin-dependent regulator of chromatin subfamily A-like protein 1
MRKQGHIPPPRSYQLDGVKFVLDALSPPPGHNTDVRAGHRAAMLADDPGLGKSLMAILVAMALGASRVLTIAPAIGRVSWPLEIRRWWPEMAHFTRVPSHNAFPSSLLDDRIFLILSYDVFSHGASLRRWNGPLRERAWDLLILDEAHYLKEGSSNRTRAIYGDRFGHRGIQSTANRVLLLTGSPTPNHAAELFPHYRTFWPDLLSHDGKPLGQTDFEERYTKYTDGAWGRAIHGSQGQDILREAFAPVLLRRRRRDVLGELPPLQVEDVPLLIKPGGPGDYVPHRDTIDRLMAVPVDTLPDALRADEVHLATLRRFLGEVKAMPAAEWAREKLSTGVDKILLFAWHTGVIDTLAKLLLDFNPVTITGATPTALRAHNVGLFQQDPGTRVFVGQIKAAGTAITLTAASHIGIVEPSWVPGENEQVVARAWRMGQVRPVLASFLYVPGSLDQRIMRAFRRKASELLPLYEAEKTERVQCHKP